MNLIRIALAALVVGSFLVACSRAEPPAAAGAPSASAGTQRFSILESLEQPEGHVLLRIHDSELGKLPGGGVILIPVYGPSRELSTLESMLNFVAARTSESQIGSISRVECGRDGFDVTTVNSLPCGCDFGKVVQVAHHGDGFEVVRMTDWKDERPGVATPAN